MSSEPKPIRKGQLLEAFCNAWRREAEDCLVTLHRQANELTELRIRLQQETDRADYWHARATPPSEENTA